MKSYLTRNKKYQRQAPIREAKKVYIFCEGDREVSYFNYFTGISSNIDIIPIGSQQGKSDPVKLKEQAEEHFLKTSLDADYRDEVWFVIDTDRWNEKDKITQLKTFCAQNKTNNNSWEVTQSNPSFEVWLYYHFKEEKPKEEDVKVCTTFKAFLIALLSEFPCAFNESSLRPKNIAPPYSEASIFFLTFFIEPFINNAPILEIKLSKIDSLTI